MNHPEFGIVLCAGMGIRLRPLTDQTPKPLLPFMDRPIASYALDALRNIGVSRIGLNAFHLPEQLNRWLNHPEDVWKAGDAPIPNTHLVTETELLGTGGGARGVWEALGSPQGTVVVINGDVVADFPLEAMLKVHRRTGAVATMMMLPAVTDERTVYLDESSNFVANLPSPSDQWSSPSYRAHHPATFGGVYLLERPVFERLTLESSCLIRHGIGPLLAEGAIVAAWKHRGFWADLGTPRRFMDATVQVLQEPSLLPGGPVRERADRIFVGDPRSIPSDLQIEGPAYIASGATIGRNVQIRPGVVVGKNCHVADGSTLGSCVLMAGASVSGEVSNRLVYDKVVARL